ncbi:MAG: hypothetical protein QM770_16375 [Tepidisphaeraceae bacterium]
MLRRFRIIALELHELDALLDRQGFELVSLFFRKLLRNFEVVHAHPNNCWPVIRYAGMEIPPVMEFTLLRKDRITERNPATQFPHLLDRTNVAGVADFPLPKCWHA